MDNFDGDVAHFESRYAGDRSVFAKFYYMPKKDETKSAEAGRPIFNDVTFIEIMVAGDANNVIQREASAMDLERFQRVYDRFLQGAEEQTIGTPLMEVPWITKSQCEELLYHKVRTLEALGNLNDEVCGRIPGLYGLKQKAKDHLKRSDAAAPVEALSAENKALKEQMAALLKTVEDQAKILTELQAKK
jgi:hypothetical protein